MCYGRVAYHMMHHSIMKSGPQNSNHQFAPSAYNSVNIKRKMNLEKTPVPPIQSLKHTEGKNIIDKKKKKPQKTPKDASAVSTQ